MRRGPLRRELAERLAQPPEEHAALILGRNEAVLRRLLTMGKSGLVATTGRSRTHPARWRTSYRRQCQTWHRVFGFDRRHPG